MRNLAGWTPLMNAAFGHRREVVEFLLDQGPNVNAADPWGCTALGRAAGWPGGSDTVRILLSHGANPNVWDSSGHTPLHDAVTRGDVETAQLLIDNGADVNAESSTLGPLRGVIYEGLPETQLAMVRLLLAAGAKVNPQITFNDPPLVMAASRGLCDVAQVLIDAGADVNVCGEQNTPLCAAVRGGKMEMIDLLLAAKGIKVNARNRYRGQTALHCAAMWKTIDPAVIARLLAHGADIKLTDESGQTAADLAEESGRHDLAARLR
jgi:ankyrin repeat protein